MTYSDLNAAERREAWPGSFAYGDDGLYWDYSAPVADLVGKALEHIEGLVGSEAAAAPLRALVQPVAVMSHPGAKTWRGVMEDTLSTGLVWPISKIIEDAGLYGFYGVTRADIALAQRRQHIRNLVAAVIIFAARPEVKNLGYGNAIQRIAALAKSRFSMDTGAGLVDLSSMAVFGGVSEGRLRNLLSGSDAVLERGPRGDVIAKSALAWLQKRNEFFRSIWDQEDAEEEVVEPIGAEDIIFVPIAKDGSMFHPGLKQGGQYQIGAKGEEEHFDSFDAALRALNAMPSPRWRRPNMQGNWGVVTGVTWSRVDRTKISAN